MKRYNLIEASILMHDMRKTYKKLKSIYIDIKEKEAEQSVVNSFLQESEEFTGEAFQIMTGNYPEKMKAEVQHMHVAVMGRLLKIRKMYSK